MAPFLPLSARLPGLDIVHSGLHQYMIIRPCLRKIRSLSRAGLATNLTVLVQTVQDPRTRVRKPASSLFMHIQCCVHVDVYSPHTLLGSRAVLNVVHGGLDVWKVAMLAHGLCLAGHQLAVDLQQIYLRISVTATPFHYIAGLRS